MLLDADINRLRHMVESIEEILQYVQGRDSEEVSTDRPVQHLILRNLEILGEAASRVSHAYRLEHPEIPWRDMIDLRNRLIHVYFDINVEVIWQTVRQDLPGLLSAIKALLERENPS